MSQIRYFTNSFIWISIAKVTDALVKFFTIPILLNYFGKVNYGILTLAISINAYMAILDLGINTGAIKYFSQWISEKKYKLIQSVSRTSISFYLIIGIVNALILILLSVFGNRLFSISQDQYELLKAMFLIMAFFSIVNWSTSVFNQLLIADEKISFIQHINIIKSLLNLLLILITIRCKLTLYSYFIIFLTLNSIVLIPYYLKAKHYRLILSFIPGNDWQNFKEILIYSLAIFAMSIFQFTATQSRPLVLGIFNKTGVGILSEYRIIEVFPVFIISIGAMLISVLLPITSKLVYQKQRDKISRIAYEGTKLTSIIVSFLCFPIILNSHEIITLYVGKEYVFLANWLNIWVFTILLYLHNSPIASLILSTGKTKMLVYSSAISCCISIAINAVLCNSFGVGSAVLGYLAYIIIQMSFYYLYFNNKILNLQSFRVFKSFLVPTIIAYITCIPFYFFRFNTLSMLLTIIVKSSCWFGLFIILLSSFNVLDIKKLFISLRKDN